MLCLWKKDICLVSACSCHIHWHFCVFVDRSTGMSTSTISFSFQTNSTSKWIITFCSCSASDAGYPPCGFSVPLSPVPLWLHRSSLLRADAVASPRSTDQIQQEQQREQSRPSCLNADAPSPGPFYLSSRIFAATSSRRSVSRAPAESHLHASWPAASWPSTHGCTSQVCCVSSQTRTWSPIPLPRQTLYSYHTNVLSVRAPEGLCPTHLSRVPSQIEVLSALRAAKAKYLCY